MLWESGSRDILMSCPVIKHESPTGCAHDAFMRRHMPCKFMVCRVTTTNISQKRDVLRLHGEVTNIWRTPRTTELRWGPERRAVPEVESVCVVRKWWWWGQVCGGARQAAAYTSFRSPVCPLLPASPPAVLLVTHCRLSITSFEFDFVTPAHILWLF